MDGFRHQTIPVKAGNLSVWSRGGTGVTVIAWPSIFYDQTMYAGLARQLGNPMIVIAGPGHGASTVVEQHLSITDLAKAVVEVADMITPFEPFAMIGTSWGSLIAAELASKGHSRLRAVALFNAPWKRESAASIADRAITLMTRFMPRSGLFRRGVASSFFAGTTLADNRQLVDSFLDQASFANPGLHAAVRSVLVTRHRDPDTDLAAISVPALVVSGEHDRLYTADVAQERASRIPSGEFRIMKGTAHVSAAEDPETAALLVEELLERI